MGDHFPPPTQSIKASTKLYGGGWGFVIYPSLWMESWISCIHKNIIASLDLVVVKGPILSLQKQQPSNRAYMIVQALISAHDQVANKEYPLQSVADDGDELMREQALRIVCIEKKSDPLVCPYLMKRIK